MSLPRLVVEAGFTAGASTSDYLHLNDTARGILDTNTLGPSLIWTDISAYLTGDVIIERGANRVESPILRYEAGRCEVRLNNSDRRFDPTNLSGPYVAAGVTQVTPMRAIRIRAVWDDSYYPLFRGFADEWDVTYVEPNVSFCTLRATDATKVLRNNKRTAVAAVGAGDITGPRVTRILNSASWSVSDRSIRGGNTSVQSTTLAGPAWDELLLVQDTEIGEIYIDAAGRVVFRNRQAMMEDQRSLNAQTLFGDQPVEPVPPLAVNTAPTTINLHNNPSVEIDLSGWGAGGSVPPTIAQSSAQAKFGTFSTLATWGTGGVLPLVDIGHPRTGFVDPGTAPLIFGETYTISVYAYVPSGGSPDVTLVVGTSGAASFGTGTGGLRDQWVRLTHTTAVTDANNWLMQIWPAASPTSGQTVYLDGVQVELGSVATPYVDGDQTPPASVVIEWDYITSGPSTLSTSRRLPELPYHDVEIEHDDTTIANQIRITRVGGAEQVVNDAASQQLYLIHTHERSDLIMQTDTVALDYAGFILTQTKDPELRFSTLDIMPQRDERALFPQVLSREFGDRIRIIRRPPGGGTITREAFIRGVRHEITPDAWATRFVLQSASKYAYLVLNHLTLGKLDENALSF